MLVTGYQPDGHRRAAHDHQRQDQHIFASQRVAEMTKNNGAQRPGEKADGKHAVGKQRGDKRVAFREVQFVKHHSGNGAVQEKVVPLDGGTKQTGNRNASQVTGSRFMHDVFLCAKKGSNGAVAAVDHQGLSGDIGAGIAGKKQRHAKQIFQLAVTPEAGIAGVALA